jgi:hypothetical protein
MGKTLVPDGVETTLCGCAGLEDRSPAEHLLRFFAANGCEYLRPRPDTIDPHPEERIKKTGSIVVSVHFRHSLLARDACAMTTDVPFGMAGLGYLANSRSVTIHQTVDPVTKNADDLVQGQLAIVRQTYSGLQPAYGWIDELGENALPKKFDSIGKVAFVFWANVFGPAFVEQFGKKFLAACPAHRVDWMEDGGAIVVSTETYSQWYTNPPKQLAEYFGRKVPGIKLYRSGGVQLPASMTFHPVTEP